MDLKKIKSKDNQLVKDILKLQTSSKERYNRREFVIEGLRIMKDAYENNISFNKLIISESALNKFSDDIKKFAKNSDDSCIVPDSLFSRMCDTKTPQGIMGIVNMPDLSNTHLNKSGKYIALENIQDPSNLGAVSRTAEALGLSGIIVSAEGCDPYSPKALRASMGTILRMPMWITEDLALFIKNSGFTSYACVVRDARLNLGEVTFEKGSICVIGNEGNGLTNATVDACDYSVTIPMTGRCESLNAAVAASIVMWEMTSK